MDTLNLDDLEIGRILHLKSETRNLKLDSSARGVSTVQFEISRSSKFNLLSFLQEDSPTISLPPSAALPAQEGSRGYTGSDPFEPMTSALERKLEKIPTGPGVYMYKDAAGMA